MFKSVLTYLIEQVNCFKKWTSDIMVNMLYYRATSQVCVCVHAVCCSVLQGVAGRYHGEHALLSHLFPGLCCHVCVCVCARICVCVRMCVGVGVSV